MMLAACCQLSLPLQAQDAVTNAFDDLKRQGTVNEQDSEMRHRASADAVRCLVAAHASQSFMCFPEDRLHDIRLNDGLLQRWLTSEGVGHNCFAATCALNEFYTWQIGVFASKQALHNITAPIELDANEGAILLLE